MSRVCGGIRLSMAQVLWFPTGIRCSPVGALRRLSEREHRRLFGRRDPGARSSAASGGKGNPPRRCGALLSQMKPRSPRSAYRTSRVIDAVKAGERVTLIVHSEPIADIVRRETLALARTADPILISVRRVVVVGVRGHGLQKGPANQPVVVNRVRLLTSGEARAMYLSRASPAPGGVAARHLGRVDGEQQQAPMRDVDPSCVLLPQPLCCAAPRPSRCTQISASSATWTRSCGSSSPRTSSASRTCSRPSCPPCTKAVSGADSPLARS